MTDPIKITDLDELLTPLETDNIVTVTGMATTPITKRMSTTTYVALLKTLILSLASEAEITEGSDEEKLITPDALAASLFGERILVWEIVAPGEQLSTGDGKAYIPLPSEIREDTEGWELVDVEAGVYTAGTTGTTTIQLNNGSNDLLEVGNLLNIDDGEVNSKDAATQASIDDTYKSLDGIYYIRIDVDSVQTTKPYGLWVKMTVRKV
jgi:hypothetical protein